MIEKLIKKIENLKLFTIRECKDNKTSTTYVDYYTETEDEVFKMPDSTKVKDIEVGVFEKSVELPEVVIKYEDDIKKAIIDYLYDEFIKIILPMGIKNNATYLERSTFEYDIKDDLTLNRRKFLSKNISCSSWIAVNGRIGTAHYMIIPENIKYLLEIPDAIEYDETDDDRIIGKIAGMKMLKSNLIEDYTLLGRCTGMDQPGVILAINSNSLVIDEIKKEIKLNMDFVDIGFFPHRQYMCVSCKLPNKIDAVELLNNILLEEIRMEKVVKKWSPILDALNIENEDKRLFIAEYMEKENWFEKTTTAAGLYDNLEIAGGNLLPQNLKVLSKINKNKKLEYGKVNDAISLSIGVTYEEIKGMKEGVTISADITRKIESELIDKLIDKINEELKDKNTLVVDRLVENISLINNDGNPKIYIKSKYTVK